MADRPVKVLFQGHYGHAWLVASEAERKIMGDSIITILKKWKASGIKLIDTFGADAGMEGYTIHCLFGVKDLQQIISMGEDCNNSEWAKYVDRYRFVVCWGDPEFEKLWQSL